MSALIESGGRMRAIGGDITALEVDCIVNAANSRLAGGGGVDGAVHRAAGPRLAAALAEIGGCPTGEARVTPGFDLPATWIIHAVGPVYHDGRRGEPELLASCYRNALALASELEIRTIAFPAISCGVYRYPVADAARIAVHEVAAFLDRDRDLAMVTFCCFQEGVLREYRKVLTTVDR